MTASLTTAGKNLYLFIFFPFEITRCDKCVGTNYYFPSDKNKALSLPSLATGQKSGGNFKGEETERERERQGRGGVTIRRTQRAPLKSLSPKEPREFSSCSQFVQECRSRATDKRARGR